MKHKIEQFKIEQSKIGPLIKQLRTEAGLTQAELADKIGYKRRWSGVSDWENEKVCPSAVYFLLIVEACGKELTFKNK